MVYKKSYKKSYKRKPMSRSGRYLDTASKALTVAYAVKKLINVEYKSLTTDFTTDPSSAGAVVNMLAIAQGDDFSNRNGRKIRLKSIRVMGHVTLNASATASTLRMVLVRDNNGSTTQPAITDLFSDVGTFAANLNKLGDPQSNSRFSILMDRFMLLDSVNSSQRTIEWYRQEDFHVFFSGTGATDEGKGAVYLFIASNEAANDPVVSVDCQVKWIDN